MISDIWYFLSLKFKFNDFIVEIKNFLHQETFPNAQLSKHSEEFEKKIVLIENPNIFL